MGEPESRVDSDYTYDTVGMDPGGYAKLEVSPVPVPKVPVLNLHQIIGQFPHWKKEQRMDYLRKRLLELSETERRDLLYCWRFWARSNQIAPEGEWLFWVLLAGRGFGKTRTGAEWVNERVQSGKSKRISLVAPTAADVRKVMVEGESGILAISPPWNRPLFEPSKLQLTWPNGAIAQLFSAEEPERLRGPQCDTFWADEVGAWKNMQMTWDMLQFGFRLGNDPRGCVTTTPKPVPLIKDLVSGEKSGEVALTRGSTYDNRGNLTKRFFDSVVKRYEGTRLGRQELDAEILLDMPGALWVRSSIDANRLYCNHKVPPVVIVSIIPGESNAIESPMVLKDAAQRVIGAVGEDLIRIVVAVDPNASNEEGSDEIGIVVAAKGMSGKSYVLHDGSMSGSPSEWATTAILLCDAFGGDRIIGEANQGGNMVEHTISSTAKFLKIEGKRSSDYIPISLVHATRGKVTRAEPVSALYEQNAVTHVGTHPVLEDQMCLFTSDFDRKSMGYSPDRVDALVWALHHLNLEGSDDGIIDFYKHQHIQKTNTARAEAKEGMVLMKSPPNKSTVYGSQGTRYVVQEGFVVVKREDVKALRTAGFVEVV